MGESGGYDEWRAAYVAAGKRRRSFETLSGVPLAPLYGPGGPLRPDGPDGPDGLDRPATSGPANQVADAADLIPGTTGSAVQPEYPGVYPYTRGPYASMYRTKLWTMRMFAGFGTPAQTNERFHELIAHGQGGLSVAFDLPTLMGRDSDDPRSLGEVGRCGVAVDTLGDFERLFSGIDLGTVSTSMTINGPAIILLAMYIATAESQGVEVSRLAGTIQNDILKEYQAQKEYIFPPRPSMRIVSDMIRYCAVEMPRYHPVSISGYHIREAGSTAAQELAFTLGNGFAYVEQASRSGIAVDEFAPTLSFFFNAHIDFFEEIAKLRAARRIWARWMKEHYGALDPLSMRCRFHVQTAGCSLTAAQAEVNIARTAIEALAGVLGGAQSLHTNSMDEVLSLPTAKAARIALRTQQVLAHETGVDSVIDPLGGSWFVEHLTTELEHQAEEILARVMDMGDGSILEGTHAGIDQGWFQGQIAESAYRQEKLVSSGERIVVGINGFTEGNDDMIPTLQIGTEVEDEQAAFVVAWRRSRDQAAWAGALDEVKRVAAKPEANLMPVVVDAVKAGCTVGEVSGALAEVFGSYEEPVFA